MGKKAPKVTTQRINPEELSYLAEAQAERNIAKSIDLERQYDPQSYAFREQSMEALLQSLGGLDEAGLSDQVLNLIERDVINGVPALELPELEQSALLNQSFAQALSDLEMGGALDQETQNLVTRNAAQRAGASGFLGGGIGRDVTARDLGLTSLDLRNQRLQTASNLGQVQQGIATQQQGMAANLAAQNAQLQLQGQQARQAGAGFLSGIQQQDLSNVLTLAGFGQGIARPVAGVDPGALASAMVADINAMNAAAGQNAANAASVKNANTTAAVGAGATIAAAAI